MIAIDRDLERRRRAIDHAEDIMKDLVFTLRGLRRTPGFAIAALLTLALGIGSATAIFSVAYGVLFRPLPYADAGRIVDVSVDLTGSGDLYGSFSAPEYVDLTRNARSFTSVGAWVPRTRTLGGDGNPVRVPAASATASLFQVFGVRALVGRTFLPEEDGPGAPAVIVLGEDLWRRRFGGDPSMIGRSILVDGVPRTIIGVTPSGVKPGGAEAFTPLGLDVARLPGRGAHFIRVAGRLRPGVKLEDARQDLAAFARQTVTEHPTNYGKNGIFVTARSLRDAWFGQARPTMIALIATVVLLLLLAAVNVANLLLVRAEARQREMGIRVALGASRTRLVRQLLTETSLLALLGAVIGVPLAALGVRALLAINPGVIPAGAEVSLDAGVVLVVLPVIVAAALVTGIIPALRAGATDVRAAIASGAVGGGRRGTRVRSTLVAVEVALAAAMLVGAGLVGRSFQKLLSVDPGFDARNAVVMELALPRVKYDTSVKTLQFTERALDEMRALRGVQAAAAAVTLPLATGTIQWSANVEGRPDSHHELRTPFMVSTSGDLFKALGVRIVRGRALAAADRDGPVSVVISETMAREYFPGEEAVGKRIALSGVEEWMTIVGVAADVRPEALSEPPAPMYYLPSTQFARITGINDDELSFVIRTTGDPAQHVNAMREVVRRIDPELALENVRTLEQVVASSVARPRFAATVLGVFGGSALLLAVVGVYGVLSYAMQRRRRELAVRMALGARPGEVRALVLRSGLGLAGAGIAAGLLVAVIGNQVIAELLYEVSPTDVLTLGVVGATLFAAALAASWIPARRATTVSPAEVLRGD